MSRPLRTAAVIAGLTGVCAAGAAVHRLGFATTPDRMLARAYDSALADSDTSWSARPPNVWLSGLEAESQSLGRQIQIGDVVTIAAKRGQPQAVRVTALEQVSGERFGMAGVRLLLVTGMAPASGSLGQRQVKFLFTSAPAEVQPMRASSANVL